MQKDVESPTCMLLTHLSLVLLSEKKEQIVYSPPNPFLSLLQPLASVSNIHEDNQLFWSSEGPNAWLKAVPR